VIAYLENREPFTTLLSPIVDDAMQPVAISVVTLAEILVLPAKAGDFKHVAALHAAVVALPAVLLVDLDETGARETAFVRATTGLPFPDAAVIATARLVDAVALIGNDRRWRPKPLGVPYEHLDDIVALA
jgi:PIN domain nuclease of toxin-antitoxin system